MRCPNCQADKDSLQVIDSRSCDSGRAIRRRRRCTQCQRRFTTYERVEDHPKLVVIKRDGNRVPWDRSKILNGLVRACYKRPVRSEDLQRAVEEVEEEVFKTHDKEVASSTIGELVIERLRRLDQVAYVRFASVYRRFKTLEELVDEAKTVMDAMRYDVPGQGVLFVPPVPSAQEPVAKPAVKPLSVPRGRRRRKPQEAEA